MTESAYEGWALVEQMGFRQTIGRVREIEQYGAKMLRLDVPFFGDDGTEAGFVTRFCGGPSIYQVTPMDEELGLAKARRQSDPRPARPMVYRLEKPSAPIDDQLGPTGVNADDVNADDPDEPF